MIGADQHSFCITLLNASFDKRLAAFIATRQQVGAEFDLNDRSSWCK